MLGAIMAKIITTVGTSIISNFVNGIEGKFDSSKSIKMQLENIEKKPYSYLTKLSDEIQKIKSELLPFLQKHKEDASAEINSINKIISTKLNEPSIVYLICTDSIEAHLCAELIKESKLIKNVIDYKIENVQSLQVFNYNEYKIGLVNLVTKLYEIIFDKNDKDRLPDKKENEYKEKVKTVFNITGGFKGIIPYLTLMGQLLKLPLYYIFENTEELIEIPQLPIQFDWALTEQYYFGLKYQSERTNTETNKLREIGFIRSDGNKSGFGKLFQILVENNYENSTTSLGHIVELKLFEFYTQNKYEGYNYVIHSDKSLNASSQKSLLGGEIDLVLSKYDQRLENGSIIFEVKSYLSLNYSDHITQLEAKLKLLKEHNFKPSEFVFFIYSLSYDYDRFKSNNQNIKKLNNLKDIIKNSLSEIKVTFKFYKIELNAKPKNHVLSEFFTNQIKANDIKTINI